MPTLPWFGLVIFLAAPIWLGIVVFLVYDPVSSSLNHRILIGIMIFWIFNVLCLDALLGVTFVLGGDVTEVWKSFMEWDSWSWGRWLVVACFAGNLLTFLRINEVAKNPDDEERWNLNAILKANYLFTGLSIGLGVIFVVAVQTANAITQFSPK